LRFDRLGLRHALPTVRPGSAFAKLSFTFAALVSAKVILVPVRDFAILGTDVPRRNVLGLTLSFDRTGGFVGGGGEAGGGGGGGGVGPGAKKTEAEP